MRKEILMASLSKVDVDSNPEIIYDIREFTGLYTWHLQYTDEITIFIIGHGTKHKLVQVLEEFEKMVSQYA